jgi:hypothetical protein
MSNDAIEYEVYRPQVEGLQKLLAASSSSIADIPTTSNGKQFTFTTNAESDATRIIDSLTHFYQTQKLPELQVTKMGLLDIITGEINRSNCSQTIKASALHTFNLISAQVNIAMSVAGEILLSFPEEMLGICRETFSKISLESVKFINDQLILSLENHLQPDSLLWLSAQGALGQDRLFLSAQALQQLEIVFSRTFDEVTRQFKIQPFFRAFSNKLPTYEFVLDISGSMARDDKLTKATQSLLTLANILFKLFPEAKLIVSTFNDKVRRLSESPYTQDTFSALQADLAELKPVSFTELYPAVAQVIKTYLNSSGKNTIFFTDGGDTSEFNLTVYLQNTGLMQANKVCELS